MQARPNIIEERSRYFSKRKCFSSHNISEDNETVYVDAVPSGSSSQPELSGISIEDDMISSRGSSTKGFKAPIPVRETNASKLRRAFLSTERLPKGEKCFKSDHGKPRWNVPSKIRYEVKSRIPGVHAAKMKKNEQSDGSESNFMKSKSDIGEKDYEFDSKTKSDIKLVPHVCHHGSYMEVIFPSMDPRRTTLLKSNNFENFDLKFVINASELYNSAEKLKEQSKNILNNRDELNDSFDSLQVSGDKQYQFLKDNYSSEQFQNLEKTKTSFVGPGTNDNMHYFDSRLKFKPYGGTRRDTQENPVDSLQNSFLVTPSARHLVNPLGREQHFESRELQKSNLGPSNQMNVFEKYSSDDQGSESKLLQNGVTITSKRYTKHERAATETKSFTKIPHPIGSVSIRKSLPAKTRSAFTLKKTLVSEDSLSSIPQYQELGNKIPKSSFNVQFAFDSKSSIDEKEKTQEDDAVQREVSNSGDSPTFLKDIEIPQEKRDSFSDFNFISNPYSEKSNGLQGVLPAKIQHSLDYQLVDCLEELKNQMNTENRRNNQTFENHTEILEDVPEVRAEKDIPEPILSPQPTVEPVVCVPCSQKVKCVTPSEGIVQYILKQLQEQGNLDLDILLFKSILVIAFISVFLFDFTNDFQLFHYFANIFRKM